MKTLDEILLIKGDLISHIEKDGIRWIPIKEICFNLFIANYGSERRRVKKDPILKNKVKLIRIKDKYHGSKILCISELDLYGYLFSIPIKSSALLWYQLKSYEILYEFFKSKPEIGYPGNI